LCFSSKFSKKLYLLVCYYDGEVPHVLAQTSAGKGSKS
jgi:hypothetical protein